MHTRSIRWVAPTISCRIILELPSAVRSWARTGTLSSSSITKRRVTSKHYGSDLARTRNPTERSDIVPDRSDAFILVWRTAIGRYIAGARYSSIETQKHGNNWTRIAHDLGYFDQMHMIHDFQALSGESPKQLNPHFEILSSISADSRL
jgi:AraC-like DNA-binding protein